MNAKGIGTRVSKHLAASTQSTLQGYPGGKRWRDASVKFGALITYADINVKDLSAPRVPNLSSYSVAVKSGS